MSLEEQVRAALSDDRYALPGWADPVERVAVRAGRRRRRRMAVTTAAVATVLVLIFVPLVFGRGLELTNPPLPADGVVPWIDERAPAPTNLARVQPMAPTRACTARDLGADQAHEPAWLEDGGRDGNEIAQTVLVGVGSDTPCTLAGAPTIVGTNPITGRRGVVTTVTGTAFDGGVKRYPATMYPGSPARVDVATRASCPGPHYRDPELTMGQIRLKVPALVIAPACPVRVSEWYVVPSLLNAPLTVYLSAPATLKRGETIEYEVRLLDALGMGIRLNPCPVYQQRLTTLVEWRRLNCAIPELPANKAVTFRMRLTVPADAPLGRGTLQWMLVFSDGRVAIAEIATGGVAVNIIA